MVDDDEEESPGRVIFPVVAVFTILLVFPVIILAALIKGEDEFNCNGVVEDEDKFMAEDEGKIPELLLLELDTVSLTPAPSNFFTSLSGSFMRAVIKLKACLVASALPLI